MTTPEKNAAILSSNDRYFLAWFQKHGRCIRRVGRDVFASSHDNTWCPYRVTSGMVERLVAAGALVKQPQDGKAEVWSLNVNKK